MKKIIIILSILFVTTFLFSGYPTWSKDAIIYNILVDKFWDGDTTNNTAGTTGANPSDGGDLQGIIDMIENNYFHNLNVSCLYLSPIYPVNKVLTEDTDVDDGGWLGFDPIDLFDVREAFGGMSKFEELLELAHQNGIKVILDHPAFWSYNHPMYTEENINKGYFRVKKEAGEWVQDPSWANYFGLLSPNHENPDIYNYLVNQAKWWAAKGLDGLRLDVATFWSEDEAFSGFIPYLFWGAYNDGIEPSYPEFLTIGEVILWYGGPALVNEYVKDGRLDGAFNHILHDRQEGSDNENKGPLIAYFVNNWMSADDVQNGKVDGYGTWWGLKEMEQYYWDASMVGWLTNHDRPRFLDLCGNDLDIFRGPLMFTFMYRDIPMIYNGDEICMNGTGGGNRSDYQTFFENHKDNDSTKYILKLYKHLSFLRRTYSTLRTGGIYHLNGTELSPHSLGFMRTGTPNILFIWNNDPSSQETFSVDVSNWAQSGDVFKNSWFDNSGNELTESYTVSGDKKLSITLPPKQGAILIQGGYEKLSSSLTINITSNGSPLAKAIVKVGPYYRMTSETGSAEFPIMFQGQQEILVMKNGETLETSNWDGISTTKSINISNGNDNIDLTIMATGTGTYLSGTARDLTTTEQFNFTDGILSLPKTNEGHEFKITCSGYVSQTITLSSQMTTTILLNTLKEKGDLNGDAVVDGLDLIKLAICFGYESTHPNFDADSDINSDDIIDGLDLIIMATNFGKSF